MRSEKKSKLLIVIQKELIVLTCYLHTLHIVNNTGDNYLFTNSNCLSFYIFKDLRVSYKFNKFDIFKCNSLHSEINI